MDKDRLDQLANGAVVDYFDNIDSVVDKIVSKIIDDNKIEDEDDIAYIRKKITRCVLKWDRIGE